ncbi:MAG: TetR/AcrR family transcriptional regulator [Methylobacteriaceae bacterium]|nr:TetR/AcrR family transcriptional regulator [Methylobacteriaceae bacterium]
MEAFTVDRAETPASRMTKPPGAYRHGDLRNALIAAATELTVQRGGPDFTLREIAGITGVRHAAVYRHFASKGALLEEIARLGAQALKTRVLAQAQSAPGERLAAIAHEYLSFAVSRPGEYRVMAQEDGASATQYRALLDMMAEPIGAARSAGAVPADISAEALTRLWWAQLHGLAMLALNSAISSGDLEECARAMSRMWLNEKPLQN